MISCGMLQRLARLASCGLMVSAVSVCLGQTPSAQNESARRTGELTGDGVYVRSGPSMNHYTIMKLSTGDRVTIVGEENRWFQILPPKGAVSLVSDQYIDTTDGLRGVINGDNVRVRAGSTLEGVTDRYTVQMKLSKGAKVSIVARTDDGFYRIKPPRGATLWISQRYVEVVPDRLVRLEEKLGDVPPGAAIPKLSPSNADGPNGDAQTKPSAESEDQSNTRDPHPLDALPATDQREQLTTIDQNMRAELEKPLLERQLDPLVLAYRAIAQQEEDLFAARYAAMRIDQMENMIGLIEAVAKVRLLNETSESLRKASLRQRTQAKVPLQPIPTGFDAVGELRRSAVFSGAFTSRRYRLVEPRGTFTEGEPYKARERTVGYVVIPAGSSIDADRYLGRMVGVRALTKKLQPGLVDPVPVYVAAEIVLIDSSASTVEQPSTPVAGSEGG